MIVDWDRLFSIQRGLTQGWWDSFVEYGPALQETAMLHEEGYPDDVTFLIREGYA